MDKHIVSVSKSLHYHIRALRHILSSITQNIARTVITALVGSRLHYANSVLYGTTRKNNSKLRKAQYLLAHVVFNTCQSNSRTLPSSTNMLTVPFTCKHQALVASLIIIIIKFL